MPVKGAFGYHLWDLGRLLRPWPGIADAPFGRTDGRHPKKPRGQGPLARVDGPLEGPPRRCFEGKRPAAVRKGHSLWDAFLSHRWSPKSNGTWRRARPKGPHSGQ